jgi:hypothetical protein
VAKSDLGKLLGEVWLVPDTGLFVACTHESVAKAIEVQMRGAEGQPVEGREGNAIPVVLWTDKHTPPARTCYRIEATLLGPISRHNHHVQIKVSYGRMLHWPWDCYEGYPPIALIAWDEHAKDTASIRDHLERRPYGINLPVYVLEGYDPDALLAHHRRIIELARSRYSVSSLLWAESPRERQVLDQGPGPDWVAFDTGQSDGSPSVTAISQNEESSNVSP